MGSPAVVHCLTVNRKSLWSYRGDDMVPFIKIMCSEPKAIPKVKDKLPSRPVADSIRLFERGQVDYKGLFPQEVLTYESNIAFTLRFMIDTKVREQGALELTSDRRHELDRGACRDVRDTLGVGEALALPT